MSNATLPLRNGKPWKRPIQFNCSLDNNEDLEDAKIDWFKNENKIDFDKEKNYEVDNEKGQLKIKYINVGRDTGNYTCVVTLKNENKKNETIEIYGKI